ncbi:hypothetical protein RvY_17201 [Ramazzottius varieornatus]|uniref:Acetyltransferase component of pyruvate dehydrogenase complex n=1 Tax=Ramazzottius varieornatus TaxID=947166 RepID=A0A1D1W1B3_RAMVA|nr:hypothetical protein RvY_17201 [Ramazzottius varieornatus]
MYKVTRNVCRTLRKPAQKTPSHPQRCLLTASRVAVAPRAYLKDCYPTVASQSSFLSGHGTLQPPTLLRGLASGSLPQHTRVNLPALSPTMERGSIKSWEKKEGDKLNEGDLLALIETDKATMDFETPEEGYLAKILVQAPAKDIPLGQLLCIIVPNKDDIGAFKDFKADDAGQPGLMQKNSVAEQQKMQESLPSQVPVSSNTLGVQAGGSSQQQQQSQQSSDSSSGGNYPEHQKIALPALSPTVEKSTIKTWGKKEGDRLSEGDLIASVETDKATIDWNYENPEPMYVAKLLVPEGTADVPIGQVVAVFVSKKEDIAAFKDYKAGSWASTPAAQQKKQPEGQQQRQEQPRQQEDRSSGQQQQQQSSAPQRQSGDRVFASPLARTIAKSKGYELSQISGTGPDGRIIAEDVNKFQPGSAAQPSQQRTADQPYQQQKPGKAPQAGKAGDGDYEDIPLTNMRQVIAKRLLQSKQTVPHYYLSVDIVLDEVLRLRTELNSMLEKEKVKLSVNDFVIKASALACKKIPQANSAWMDSFIRQFNMVDVSVAVSTEAGLITPIVFSADSKGLVDINADVVRLAEAAKKGKLKPQEFQGGTFTVSNLGMFGIKNFSAVINPPQSCILAVGGAQKQLIADEKSKEGYRVASVMSVTLSCDHRVVDGAVGAQWLKHFKQLLEQPETMLL